ncbi:MAG: TlyA family RNA methyltransferase [Sphaerochaetaceae bacterium]|nr:TlyA family RNA methyltransferase [Sphaerochaetaceae bacterium]
MAKESILKLLMKVDASLTKDKAFSLVVCKNVYVNGELCTDPRAVFPQNATVEVLFPKYVSRGGFKLEKALEVFNLDVRGKVVLDGGSSTGGFTDCLLQKGASIVHSVDVGFNLLDYKIRSDSRVVVHEKTNIMAVKKEDLNPIPDCAVADLSFRSISGAASHLLNLVGNTWVVALIKPQFEVPRWQENFFGVIEDMDLLKATMENVYDILQKDNVAIKQVTVSPIRGHKGNREFLALLTTTEGLSKASFLEEAFNGVIL